LQTKAPTLWNTLTTGTAVFRHIQASGADALEEFRVAFSKTWLKKFYALREPLLAAAGRPYAAIDPDMEVHDLYDCRRDCEGVPYSRAAQMREPASSAAQASFFHHLLLQAGATREGPWYKYDGKRVRIVQGAGRDLKSVQEKHQEPPAADHPDVVVCVGAVDLAVPGSLISPGVGSSVVRPSGGGGAQWMTLEKARGVLAI
jgi:hypothetical protein